MQIRDGDDEANIMRLPFANDPSSFSRPDCGLRAGGFS